MYGNHATREVLISADECQSPSRPFSADFEHPLAVIFDYISIMISAGYLRDMVKTTQLNRSLLKASEAGKFNNFDREAYLGDSKTRTKLTFKQASPELLIAIRDQMISENKRNAQYSEAVFLLSTLFGGLLAAVMFWL